MLYSCNYHCETIGTKRQNAELADFWLTSFNFAV